MNHNENKTGNNQPTINVKNKLDVHYWSSVLNTTPQQLKKAVKEIGSSVDEVKKYLNPELPNKPDKGLR